MKKLFENILRGLFKKDQEFAINTDEDEWGIAVYKIHFEPTSPANANKEAMKAIKELLKELLKNEFEGTIVIIRGLISFF